MPYPERAPTPGFPPHRAQIGPANGPTRAMVSRALLEGRVTVAFQPVVDARCLTRASFHEALVRLRSPSGTLVAPGQFLPAIEGSAMAAAVDRVVLARVIDTLRAEPEARISLNVGAATLEDQDWMAALTVAATEAPDIAYRLIVEMTESSGVLNHPAAPSFLGGIRDLGVSTALDDFGAGATGFHHFRRTRFDVVKIDGAYGDGLAGDHDAEALVRAMVALAQHFEMMTVIEHIDTPRDAARAIELGVDALQGYLFGRPEPAMRPPSARDGGAGDTGGVSYP